MVVTTALTLTLAATTAAHADSHGGGPNFYDFKNPTVPYNGAPACNINASQIATRPIRDRSTGAQVATIQIFYSWSCQTNWFRVTNNPYGGNTTKNIFSALGGWNSERDFGYGSSYTMMVYAPGNTAINGEVFLFAPGINEWNWKAEGTFSL